MNETTEHRERPVPSTHLQLLPAPRGTNAPKEYTGREAKERGGISSLTGRMSDSGSDDECVCAHSDHCDHYFALYLTVIAALVQQRQKAEKREDREESKDE